MNGPMRILKGTSGMLAKATGSTASTKRMGEMVGKVLGTTDPTKTMIEPAPIKRKTPSSEATSARERFEKTQKKPSGTGSYDTMNKQQQQHIVKGLQDRVSKNFPSQAAKNKIQLKEQLRNEPRKEYEPGLIYRIGAGSMHLPSMFRKYYK